MGCSFVPPSTVARAVRCAIFELTKVGPAVRLEQGLWLLDAKSLGPVQILLVESVGCFQELALLLAPMRRRLALQTRCPVVLPHHHNPNQCRCHQEHRRAPVVVALLVVEVATALAWVDTVAATFGSMDLVL